MRKNIMTEYHPVDGDDVPDIIIRYVAESVPQVSEKEQVAKIVTEYFGTIASQGFTEHKREQTSGMRLSNGHKDWEYDIQVRVVINEDDPKETMFQMLLTRLIHDYKAIGIYEQEQDVTIFIYRAKPRLGRSNAH
jgi:hypothetical protein